MNKIAKLPETVINQIAAGEVVENSASIVKELIENCLDAGAKRINVSIQMGGQHLIEVEDDGCGMGPEDARLSLERHATSKIRSADDLFDLATLGFRGEALAAIASVSHLDLKTSDGHVGTHIAVSGGAVTAVSPLARNRGTTISVRSLFFNTPARKKFQKSVSANTAQVRRVVEAAALANPEVAFSLKSEKEIILQTHPEEKKKRVEALLGSFAHEINKGSIWGLLSAPIEAKSHRRAQYLFINRRPVYSPLIAKAVQAGYGTRLAEGQYPPFVLFLEIDPKEVDVNVHPQKREIRFSDESMLFQLVESAVASSFEAPASFGNKLFFDPPSFRMEETLPSFLPPPVAEAPSWILPLEIPVRPLAVWDRYLLIEKEGLFLVDLRRASARLLFESLHSKNEEKQSLLSPIVIDRIEDETFDSLIKIGIDCRWIGPKRIAVDAIPSQIEPFRFLDFFSAWNEEKSVERAASRFCYSNKRRYTLDEANHVWNALQNCADRLYDPMGHLIMKELQVRDFEKWLDRE